MGMGFRLNIKWGFKLQSPSFTNQSSWPSSYSFKSLETSYESTRISFPSVFSGESETMYNDSLRAYSSSSFEQLSNEYSEAEHTKINCSKSYMIDNNIQMPTGEDRLTFLTCLQATKTSRFKVLMNNLNMLEKTFADSDVIRLERDILVQLERLGALRLFNACLSRTRSPTLADLSGVPAEFIEELETNNHVDDHVTKIVVRSGKKEKRKEKRVRASKNAKHVCAVKFPLKTNHKDHPQQQKTSSSRRSVKYSGRRPKISRNEAELSRGVKLVTNLERIRMIVEEEAGQAVSLSSWAEAAGVDKKTLQQNLQFGWCCQDELLRNTRPLIVYLARNYRSLGMAFEDLIQAGSFGVLQGAERFDHSRGYKFSTYIQYWIRKSMLMLVGRNARGVRIPFALSKAMNKIQKARKSLCNSHGKYPDDEEIAKFTGLSLAKITSASKCFRVVGSLDQKIGDLTTVKYLELTPDSSLKSPEETVNRQHMINDIYDLLDDLDPKEKQVLLLRFGLRDHQCKSLQEIGRLFCVSKEWIRQIERTALTKLRDRETLHNLNYYLYM